MTMVLQLIGLSPNALNAEIRTLFSKIGPVIDVQGPIARTATVRMEKNEDAERAAKELKGTLLGGESFSIVLLKKAKSAEAERADTESQQKIFEILFYSTKEWTIEKDQVGPLKFGMTENEIFDKLGPSTEKLEWDHLVYAYQVELQPSPALRDDWLVLRYADKGIEQKLTAASQIKAGIFPQEALNFAGLTLFVSRSRGLCAINFFLSEIRPTLKSQALLEIPFSLAATIQFQNPRMWFYGGVGVSGTSIENQKVGGVFVSDIGFVKENTSIRSLYPDVKPQTKAALSAFVKNSPVSNFLRGTTLLKKKSAKLLKNGAEQVLVGENLSNSERLRKVCKACHESLSHVLHIPTASGVFAEKTKDGALEFWACLSDDCAGEDAVLTTELCFLVQKDIPEDLPSRTFQENGMYYESNGDVSGEFPEESNSFELDVHAELEKQNTSPEKIASFLHALRFHKTEKGSKIGGWPHWLQAPHVPACSKCNSHTSMRLLLQLNAEHPLNFGHDVGLNYFFQCERHPEVFAWSWQSF